MDKQPEQCITRGGDLNSENNLEFPAGAYQTVNAARRAVVKGKRQRQKLQVFAGYAEADSTSVFGGQIPAPGKRIVPPRHVSTLFCGSSLAQGARYGPFAANHSPG
jgi:hypothetical protein